MCLPSSRGSGNSSARCWCRGRSPCSSTVSEDPCVILRPPPDAPLYRSHPQRAPLPASVTISVLVNLTADGISRRVCRPAAGPQLYRADAHYPEGLIRHLDAQLAWIDAIAALEHPLFHVQYGPVAPQWCSDALLAAPPSDGDCHTPLPREVRRGKDSTPRACSLR